MAETKICTIPECCNPASTKGFCNSHYLRMRRHGSPYAGTTGKGAPKAWLLSFLMENTLECVDWPFARNGNGYGWAWHDGKRIGAHRLALALHTGQNPKGLDAAHSCHNRKCVNPKHLRWATRGENALDKRKDGTSHSKITLDDAVSIRSSVDGSRELAEKFGISISSVQKIRSGKHWK